MEAWLCTGDLKRKLGTRPRNIQVLKICYNPLKCGAVHAKHSILVRFELCTPAFDF